MSTDGNKVRPSEEIIAISDHFLGTPGLNVAVQVGQIELGPIARHIIHKYREMEAKVGKGGEYKKILKGAEKRVYPVFQIFVEKTIPLIAAEYGPNISDQLIQGYIATTQNRVIVASGVRADVSAVLKEAQAETTTPTKNSTGAKA